MMSVILLSESAVPLPLTKPYFESDKILQSLRKLYNLLYIIFSKIFAMLDINDIGL